MSQKTLRNFQIPGALYSGVGAGAQPAQAGDEVRLFLNQTANPEFPEYIDGIIQPPVTDINVVDSGGHLVPGTSYSFSYESDDLDGAAESLTACDIINATVITCCVALRESLDAEIAARAAGDAALAADIAEVQADLDGWDVTTQEPTDGVTGVPQVETQTVVGSIVTGGVIEVTVTAAGLTGSPVTYEVDVDAGDVASIVAAKTAARIALDEDLVAIYDVDNIGSSFALTQKVANGNDNTLNIEIANGSATGLTPDASSTNTVTGVAEVTGTVPDKIGQHAHHGERIWEATDISPPKWVEITTERNGALHHAALTGLTGGGSTNLDGISVLATTDVGRLELVEVSGNLYPMELTTDVAAESSPTVVLPDNFDAVNNIVSWKLRYAVTRSSAILDASAGGFGPDDSGDVLKFSADGSITCTDSLRIINNATGFASTFSTTLLSTDRTHTLPDDSGVMLLRQTVVPATPTTGFTITASPRVDQTHYLTPAGTLATGTFTLPTAANSREGQIVRLWSTQIVTALTVNVSGGGTILGTALTAAAVNTPYAYECVSTSGSGTWIRLQ